MASRVSSKIADVLRTDVALCTQPFSNPEWRTVRTGVQYSSPPLMRVLDTDKR